MFDNKSKLDYCGNHVYRDSVLERITNDYGYWADGSCDQLSIQKGYMHMYNKRHK